jgi:hypothetical protein
VKKPGSLQPSEKVWEERARHKNSWSLHKNSANRIIALNFAELVEGWQRFPQGFPLLC